MQNYLFAVVLIVLIHNCSFVLSSPGDQSPYYLTCNKKCMKENCTTDGSSFTSKTRHLQDEWSQALQWSCRDECRYNCMWRTVQALRRNGLQVLKFHGKWPFKRIYGVQEPASAVCSLLNLAAHLYMYSKILRDRRFSIKNTPMLLFWHIFVFICVHAWTWSTIFHTRDTDFTEFMDYAGALSMVMGLAVSAFVRAFYTRRLVTGGVALLSLVYYAEHARYLLAGRIDYQYNMAVNVVCGVIGFAMWIVWCLTHVWRTGSRYVWRMVVFSKLTAAALLLELGDFAPLLDAWDAHALWHLSTAPLPLLFYRFVIDDLEYLQTAEKADKIDLKLA